jgi:septal ring factor EnvC (AmiA/AmiB activator)
MAERVRQKASSSEVGSTILLKQESSDKNAKFNYKDIKKSLEKELRKIEGDIRDLEAFTEESKQTLEALNESLLSPTSNKVEISQKLAETQTRLDQSEEEWLSLLEQREVLLARLIHALK